MQGYEVTQNSTAYPLTFLLISSTDHITGLTGATPTVTISKNGGAYAAPAGAISEIGNGLYKVAGNATDTNTLGPIWLHATATGADPTDPCFPCVAVNPQSTGYGLVDVSANVAQWNGSAVATPNHAGYPLVDIAYILGTTSAGTAGYVGIDWAHVNAPTTTLILSGTTISTSQAVASVSGAVGSVTGNVGGNVAGSTASVTGAVGSVTGLTTSTIAAAVLATPAHPLATDSSGNSLISLTQSIPASNTAQTVGDALNASRAQGFGAWTVAGTTLTLYAGDGVTVVRTFTLNSSTAPTSRT
jgi:hypothetical protein